MPRHRARSVRFQAEGLLDLKPAQQVAQQVALQLALRSALRSAPRLRSHLAALQTVYLAILLTPRLPPTSADQDSFSALRRI
jgi:hypothetical protein